jgi:hypothetical protein
MFWKNTRDEMWQEENRSRNVTYSTTLEGEKLWQHIYSIVSEKANKNPNKFVEMVEFIDKFWDTYVVQRKVVDKDILIPQLQTIQDYSETYLPLKKGTKDRVGVIRTILHLIEGGEGLPL